MPSMPSGPHAVALAPGAHHELARRAPRRRASRARARPGSTGPGRSSARTSQRRTGSCPGRVSAPASGSGARLGGAAKRTMPVLADRPHAAAEVDLAALGLARPGADLRRPARARAGPRGRRRARRARAARGARSAGSAARERLGADRHAPAPAPAASSASSTTRSRSAASSASSACVSAMFRSAAGLSSRSTGSTSARIRLRAKLGSSVRLVVGERQPGRRRRARASRSRSSVEQRAHDAPARAGRPSSARRPGETASR